MSTRRIPKGPGRRPKSLARQQFMELLAQGVPLRVACLEVGVSRSTGQIWKNGTTVRRRDGTVKIVPPLERLAVRPISPRFLSEEERVRIADMASRGDGPTVIGKAIGRAARRSAASCAATCTRPASTARSTPRYSQHNDADDPNSPSSPVTPSYAGSSSTVWLSGGPATDQSRTARGAPRRARHAAGHRKHLFGAVSASERPCQQALTATDGPGPPAGTCPPHQGRATVRPTHAQRS